MTQTPSNEIRSEDAALVGVDRAALIFAAAGSAAAITGSAGNFSAMSAFWGASFVLLVLAFHRPATGPFMRVALVRLAFGAALTTSLFLMLGYWLGRTDDYLGEGRLVVAILATLIFAAAEPLFGLALRWEPTRPLRRRG